jgi:hypothetical protein
MEKVRVLITGQATARYAKTLFIKRDEYAELNSMLDSDDRKEQRKAISRIETMLTGYDICDVDDFELEDFRAEEQQRHGAGEQ